MTRKLGVGPQVLTVAFGVGLAACSFDSGVSAPSPGTDQTDAGVVLSGGGVTGAGSEAGGYDFGDDPVSASPGARVSAGGSTGANGSGGAAWGGIGSWGAHAAAGAGGTGGATSGRGGTAGAGGATGHEGGVGGGAPTAVHSLFFSEYIEGSSSNKALEIFASKSSSLDGCKVGAYFNGKGEASVVANLSGQLAAGAVRTLCTSTLKTKLPGSCDQVANLTFNGDDAIALECDGKLLDVIGQIGADPGGSWGATGVTTLDHTLRRKCSVSAGDPSGLDAFTPSKEWQAFPSDTFDGLGARGC